MTDAVPSDAVLEAVPLFPLPNVVLFPRAVLPLHIFEQRYREMTADVLAGQRQVAMALLRPGWEKSYYGRPAVEPVVCVGTILSHEQLPDGKYNFLLQGHTRARIVEELEIDKPYRVARLEPLVEKAVMEIDLSDHRRRLVELLAEGSKFTPGLTGQFRKLLSGAWATVDIADLIAFNYFEDSALKQSLLSDVDVEHRVGRIVAELKVLALQITPLRSPGPPNLN
jgi:Lon protease-like protein